MLNNKTFFTTGINESYTITAPAGADIADARGRGFKFDSNGNFVLAGAGERVIGVGIMTAGSEYGAVLEGEDITVQVKGMGRAYLAAAVNPGDELTADANGNFVVASAGDSVSAVAIKKGEQDTLGFVLFSR